MSASFLRRLLCTAAIAGGVLVLGGGAANATDIVPVGDAVLTQTQDATNTNTTDQTATANAETNQYNVNAPIAILSPGANSGDVDQSNTADTSATAGNSNTTDQSVSQDQYGTTSGGCGSCGGGSVSQDQSGENSNDTTQDSEANAETNQYNVNAPISILSPGANGSSCDPCGGSGGDVNQSNDADTSAWAGNSNVTTQTVDQSQDATVAGSGFCGCEAPSIQQSQTGTNDNSTDQTATANAETNQYNVNAPIAILSPGANNGDVDQSNQADTDATAYNGNSTDQSIWQDQDAAVRGDGCGTCHGGGGSISQDQTGENTNDTHQDATANAATEQENNNVPTADWSPDCGCYGGGDVNQSNDATTTAWAGNSNSTAQSVNQDQDGVVHGAPGCGGCEPDPCACEPDPCHKGCDPAPCHKGCDPAPCHKGCDPAPCHNWCQPAPCGCPHSGSIDQSQTGSNANDTHQNAEANANTYQTNENEPYSYVSPGANGGDVTQSNDATTTAWAGNWNDTLQSVDQQQFAAMRR
jgi:hypothetical protein